MTDHGGTRVYRCTCGSWTLAPTSGLADEIRAGQHIPTCTHLRPHIERQAS